MLKGLSIVEMLFIGMLGATATLADEVPLIGDQVKRYMQIEVELTELLRRYQASADQYQDAPRAFGLAEKKYLAAQGYSESQWEALEMRIVNASNALAEHGEVKSGQQQRQADVNQTCREASDYASEQSQMKAAQYAQAQEVASQMRAAGMPEATIQDVLRQFEDLPTLAEARSDQCDLLAAAVPKMNAEEIRAINASRPDWPAVRPYRQTLEQLWDWTAGNRANPPNIE